MTYNLQPTTYNLKLFLPPRLLNLLLHLIHNNQMPGVLEYFGHKTIFKAQTIEEIRLGEDGILHMAVLCILREERFHQFLANSPDEKEINLALRSTEAAGEEP